MRKKWLQVGKRTMAAALTAMMAVSGVSVAAPLTAEAAGTAVAREDDSLVYFVDCGDYNVNTVSEGDQLGTHNSVTDQVYGADKATGYKWGIDDTVSDPLKNGAGSCPSGGVSTDWTWPLEELSGDGIPKTSTNRYTKNQYEKGIEERHLDYKFELENGTYYVEIGCADPWGVSRSPVVYLNKGKDSAVTLAEALNVPGGEIAAGSVSVADGELTVNLRGAGDDNKAINVTYIIIKEAGDSSMVQTDLDALVVKERTSTNLTLLTTGKAGSTIQWKSSNTNVITNDGKVTRPAAGEEDVVVTLTATVTYGEAMKTKEFVVTVLAESDLMGTKELGITNVTVTDSYYKNSLDKEIRYMLKLDPDRLLAGFRETAAYVAKMPDAERKSYMKDKTRYLGGWENGLIGGHTLGHWMTAMAQAYANKGTSAANKAALKERLDSVISALKECQEKTAGTEYEGYLFGATLPSTTDLDIQFDNVEKKLTDIYKQAWVPWYTMHKIQAGLISAYELTGSEDAYEVAKKLGDWTYNRVSKWSEDTQKKVLATEYGGMNDCLYDLYAAVKAKEGETAAAKYAEAAHKFDEIDLFELIYKGNTQNAVDGLHANTTIPKFLGALKRYIVLGDEKYLEYVDVFWDYVLNHHSYITGGNSEWEHFGADDILDKERTNCNCETCNTYNMLKMTRQLFMITGDPKYTDYYENTLINAIMSSQNPETGMSMYFQPMASGYQKVFGTEEGSFWCCTGSGMENFTKLNDSVYYQKDKTLIVAQYLASAVEFEAGNMKVTQTGDLTKTGEMRFGIEKLAEDGDMDGELRLRLPDWLAGDAAVTIGGNSYDYAVKDRYAVIPASAFSSGSEIVITLPMKAVAYNLPDGENTYAFKYGPYVLSAKLGTSNQTQDTTGVSVSIPTTKAIANDRVFITSADTVKEYMDDIQKNLVKADGKLEFQLKGTSNTFTFVPHYSQYTESYAIYWTYSVDEDARGSEAIISEKNAARVEAAILEGARPGYGQDELGFKESGNGSQGSTSPAFRYAKAGGTFQYDIKVTESGDNYLLCAFDKADDGKTIKITVGGTEIFAGTLNSESEDAININLPDSDAMSSYQMRFRIPAAAISANKKNSRSAGKEMQTAEDGYAFIPVVFSSNNAEDSAKIVGKFYMMRAYRTENALTGITSSTGKVTKEGAGYKLVVPYDKAAKAKFGLQDSTGYVMVEGNAIDETQEKTLTTTGVETTIPITVWAEDFETRQEYTLKVVYDYTGFDAILKNCYVNGYTFNETVGGAVAVTKAFPPKEAANPTYTYVDGKEGKAIKLSGSYGLKLEGASEMGESYTISWWMKPDKLNGVNDPTFAAGTFSPQYWLNATFDAKIWSYKGGYIDTPAANAYRANEWQHVAVVVDGSTDGTVSGAAVGTLYLNGREVSKGNVAKGIMTNANAGLYFGVNAWDDYYQGALDEVMLFKKALSAAEVQGLSGTVIKASALGAEDPAKKDDDNNGNDNNNGTNNGNNNSDSNSNSNNTGGNKTDTGDNGNGNPAGGNETKQVKRGTTVTDTKSGASYRVTTTGDSQKATVEYVKPTGKKARAATITIPDTVKVNGVICKVTSIKAKCFKNNKKLKKLTIGKNIKKIGAQAFYSCKKLKTIVVRTKKLTAKNIGKNAFKKINAKAKIKVPKSKLKAYKKLFKKKGLGSKVKVVASK